MDTNTEKTEDKLFITAEELVEYLRERVSVMSKALYFCIYLVRL